MRGDREVVGGAGEGALGHSKAAPAERASHRGRVLGNLPGMLTSLAIRDLVLIDALELDLGEGLTVLTGETGAGKSILLGALGLALGARGEASWVRVGAKAASAAAIFELEADDPVCGFLAERGLAGVESEGKTLILRRVLDADGRSRSFVNDEPAGLQVLRQAGEALVEIHGRHHTAGLLDPKTHRDLLDRFGDCGAARQESAAAWRAWRAALGEEDRTREAALLGAAEREDLAARLAELEALAPKAGEEAALS
ncbi:MAG: AAA family ATPase, partial [Caulobacteraceae bacterium]